MKIIEKSGYQALPWVRYITQSGGKFKCDQVPVVPLLKCNGQIHACKLYLL